MDNSKIIKTIFNSEPTRFVINHLYYNRDVPYQFFLNQPYDVKWIDLITKLIDAKMIESTYSKASGFGGRLRSLKRSSFNLTPLLRNMWGYLDAALKVDDNYVLIQLSAGEFSKFANHFKNFLYSKDDKEITKTNCFASLSFSRFETYSKLHTTKTQDTARPSA